MCTNLPRLSESLSSTDNETSSDSTADGNHSNVAGLQTTVQMRVVRMNRDAITVEHGFSNNVSPVVRLLAIVFVAVFGVGGMWAAAVRRRSLLVPVPDGHVGNQAQVCGEELLYMEEEGSGKHEAGRRLRG